MYPYNGQTYDYVIEEDDIKMIGQTEPPRGEHPFIVFYLDEDLMTPGNGLTGPKVELSAGVYVTSAITKWEDEIYKCHLMYTRRLCNTLEQLVAMPYNDIEAQAYNAWMDGAR